MSIQRRRFVRGLVVAPIAPAALAAAQQVATPSPSQQQQPQPQPNTPAQQNPRQPQSIAPLKTTAADLTGETDHLYFSAAQFATLTKLAGVLVPPVKGNPGAVDTQAPEFLDFLISVSPAERQATYKSGLDHLEAEAQGKFQKPFGQLSNTEADTILKPLMTVRLWPHDLPQEPEKSFIAQVHEDLRTATMNSREWAAASEKAGRRFTRGARTRGLYWYPIDPISQG